MDRQLFFLLHNLSGQSRAADSLIIFLASSLAYVLAIFFLFFLVFAVRSIRQKSVLFVLGLVAAGAARGIVTELIRFFYHRPRPFAVYQIHQLLIARSFSFPSGHMTFFFALATVVFLENRRWGIAFYALSLLMGLARVAAGIHYITDILGGIAIGVAVGWLTVWVYNKKFQSLEQ